MFLLDYVQHIQPCIHIICQIKSSILHLFFNHLSLVLSMQISSFSKIRCMTKSPTSIYHVKQSCLQYIKIYPSFILYQRILLSNVIALGKMDISFCFLQVTFYPATSLTMLGIAIENIL